MCVQAYYMVHVRVCARVCVRVQVRVRVCVRTLVRVLAPARMCACVHVRGRALSRIHAAYDAAEVPISNQSCAYN